VWGDQRPAEETEKHDNDEDKSSEVEEKGNESEANEDEETNEDDETPNCGIGKGSQRTTTETRCHHEDIAMTLDFLHILGISIVSDSNPTPTLS